MIALTRRAGLALCLLLLPSYVLAQDLPATQYLSHAQGQLGVTVTNNGGIVAGTLENLGVDPINGRRVLFAEYPLGSGIGYMPSNLIVGGIRGADTLVTVVRWGPDFSRWPGVRIESIDRTLDFFAETARSPLDIISQYSDTASALRAPDTLSDLSHSPLGVLVSQRSMSWSGGNLDGMVLYEVSVENITNELLRDVVVGIAVSTGGKHISERIISSPYLQRGALHYFDREPSTSRCGVRLPIELFTTWDLAGQPLNGSYTARSVLGSMGIRILSFPSDLVRGVTFNWVSLIQSGIFYSPAIPSDNVGGLGIDLRFGNDTEFYRFLANRNFDFNPLFSGVPFAIGQYLPPPRSALQSIVRDGFALTGYLSLGTFDLAPGEDATFVFAVVAGDSVITDPTTYERLAVEDPNAYLSELDFSEITENTLWATWVYDNPGIDSDGDGFRGEYYLCEGDTVWWKGDGIADWRADVPPPAPFVEVLPETGKLTVRWNGYFSETTVDPFTQQQDFEGYRVYIGRDERPSSASLLTSWDAENYNRFELIQRESGDFEWLNRENPFSIDSLETLYGLGFDPLLYTRQTPLRVDGSIFYFEPQDFNVSELGIPGRIRKRFPNQPKPDPDPANWSDDEVIFGPDNRRLPKYYEYEYVIDSLLPSVPWYVAVTAFDFGFAKGGIPAKESPLLTTQTESYALTSATTAVSENLDVFVYPNPYRSDDNYVQEGFEDRLKTRNPQLEKRIHFANLPPKCTIEIYSLDGDRIITIDHDEPPGSPNASHAIWNIVSRNRQIVTSGTYYWVVTSDQRTQIGTLVIIK